MSAVVLVTGGAGYVGSHVCKALAAEGMQPVAFDNMSTGHEWAVKWGPLEVGDLASAERLAEVFATHKPAAVIHLAANAYVGESVADPAKYYGNNVGGSLSLLNAMRAAEVPHIVFSSSCVVYGPPDKCPIGEDHPRNPQNPYGVTKMTVERMLEDFDTAYGVRSMSLRYFNAAGADADGEIGEDHDPETHLIPLALDAVTGRQQVLPVFGTDYGTPDGTAVRDYIHVDDLARAHVAALGKLVAGGASDAMNLGTGTGASVREVIAAVEKVTGKAVPTRDADRRPGDAPAMFADATRARTALDWAPRFPELADIVETAWRWHRNHFGGGG